MPRRLSVLVLSLVLAVALPALTPEARAAQDDGVRIDPDSPPAIEYELPLDAARGVGTGTGFAGGGGGGGTSSGSGADGRPPAFGSGITPKPAAAPSGPRTRDGGSAANGSEGGGAGARAGSDAAGASASRPSPSIDGGDGSPLLYSVGGALVVFLAGGLVALALRRRQSTT